MKKLTQLASLVRSDVVGIAWPALSSGTSATLAALVLHLNDTEWASEPEIVAHQHRQLVLLAEHAAKHSPHFRERLSQAKLHPGDLGTPEGLRTLPVLRRRDVQTPGRALYCKEVPEAHKPIVEGKTSGSTGEPVVVKKTSMNQLFWSAMTIRDHLWHERDFSKGLSAIRAKIAAYAVAPNWGRPMNLLFNTGPSQSIPSMADISKQFNWLHEFRPDNILIYPTSLNALAQYCQQNDVALPTLRHIRTIGETLSPGIRAFASEVFPAKVEDVYSSEELGLMAVQCPDSELYHVMAEAVIVEVLNDRGGPCRDGEIGRIVVTDLHNFATPMIRYDIGDYAEVAGPCPCGRGLPSLRRIVGRERNLIVMPDGTRQWPLTGFRRFRDIAPIRQYQFIQHDHQRVEVRLVSDRPVSPQEEAALGKVIQTALGHAFDLSFVYFDDQLPRGPGGKFEEVVSNVSG